jgi:CspA family cold shock protein
MQQKGSVVRLIRDRGFGFLRIPDGSEVFFHHSAMNPGEFDSLHEGEELEFTLEQDVRGRGTRAANVRRAGMASNT